MTGASLTTTRLAELEDVIQRGLRTFVEVGEALAEIQESRLYRESHGTFEDYCRERWGMSRSYAHRTIEAAQIVAVLPNGNRPGNEAQARELAPLSGDEQGIVAAWREAQAEAERHGTTISAKTVKNAVRKRVARIEREAKNDAARGREWTCGDCGTTGPMTIDPSAGDGVSYTYHLADGEWTCLCLACSKRRGEARRREHEEWWASLTDGERQERIEAKRDRDDGRKLAGSLQMFEGWYQEIDYADALRCELDALWHVEAWRHPDLLARLANVVADLEEAISEYREYVDNQRAHAPRNALQEGTSA